MHNFRKIGLAFACVAALVMAAGALWLEYSVDPQRMGLTRAAAGTRPLPESLPTEPSTAVITSRVAAESLLATDSPRSVRVVVRDEHARPVSGAQVEWTGIADPVPGIELVDPPGSYDILLKDSDALALGRIEIFVAASGHAAESVVLLPEVSQVTVVLHPEEVLRGRVTFPDGVYATVPLRALAWRGAHCPSDLALRTAMAGRGLLPTCPVEGDGSFVLRGLRAGVPYSITVGGQGFVAMNRQVGFVLPRVEGIEFEMARVYASNVIFRDQLGGPAGRSTFRKITYSTPGFLELFRAEYAITGIEVASRSADNDFSIAAKSRSLDSDIGPLDLEFEAPGFQSSNLQVPLPLFVGGKPAEFSLSLNRHNELGCVRVRFENSGVSAHSGGDWKSILKLSLSMDGGHGNFEMDIFDLSQDAVISGVPVGDYSVRLAWNDRIKFESGNFARRIRVESSAAAETWFDMGGFGRLEFDGKFGGSQYRDSLTVQLVGSDGSDMGRYLLSGAFPRLDGLPPGRYSCILEGHSLEGGSFNDLRSSKIDVSILAGATTLVSFALGKKQR